MIPGVDDAAPLARTCRRCGALVVGLSGAWLLAAGCAASGSNGQVNGPMFDFDTGVDGGPGVGNDGGADAIGPTNGHDANDPLDATKVSPPSDATPPSTVDGSDASGGGDAGCTATTAVLGGNAALNLFGAIARGTGEYTASTLTGSVTTTPALVAFNGGFQGLITENGGAGGGNALFALGFSGGAWSTPTALGGIAAAIGAPSMAAVGSTLQGVYLNPEHLYFHASYASGWNAGADPVEVDGGTQAFGPVPSAAAGTATQLVIAYEGNNLLPYAQTWTSGVGWDNGVALGSATLLANTAMPIVALDSGDLLVVYAEAGGSCSNDAECLYSVTGSASPPRTWTPPVLVNATAYSPKAATLAPMSGGRALLAWQGGNGEGYGSIYTSGATPAWSTPAQLTSAQVALAPSLAQGVCGDDAVAAYVSSGQVYTTHFAGGAWTTPAALSSFSGSTSVSIATSP